MRFAERTTISAEEAARAYGIGRHAAYDNAEQLGGIRVGRRLVFPVAIVAKRIGKTEAELLALCDRPNGNGRS